MAYLDDCTIYLFVRGDLREEDQAIQLAHAVFKMTALIHPGYGDVKMVALDGGSSEKAFSKALRKIKEAQLQHAEYSDSDHPEWGITAIATAPLNKEQSLPLANYRLRRYSPPSAASAEVALDGQGRASLNGPAHGLANRTICTAEAMGYSGLRSSEKEHSVSNGEVAGSIPAASSSINCS